MIIPLGTILEFDLVTYLAELLEGVDGRLIKTGNCQRFNATQFRVADRETGRRSTQGTVKFRLCNLTHMERIGLPTRKVAVLEGYPDGNQHQSSTVAETDLVGWTPLEIKPTDSKSSGCLKCGRVT